MNLIESWGSGIPKLMAAMQEYGLREPEFIDTETSFRVNMYRKTSPMANIGESSENHRRNSEKTSEKPEKALNDTQQKIIELLQSDSRLSAAALAEKIGISSRNIESNLSKLKAQGLLIRHGSARGGYWEIVG